MPRSPPALSSPKNRCAAGRFGSGGLHRRIRCLLVISLLGQNRFDEARKRLPETEGWLAYDDLAAYVAEPGEGSLIGGERAISTVTTGSLQATTGRTRRPKQHRRRTLGPDSQTLQPSSA
jgi:2-phospho-L-lactate transferase/gluconeogenesis factor (CofD/UPF0052 family)